MKIGLTCIDANDARNKKIFQLFINVFEQVTQQRKDVELYLLTSNSNDLITTVTSINIIQPKQNITNKIFAFWNNYFLLPRQINSLKLDAIFNINFNLKNIKVKQILINDYTENIEQKNLFTVINLFQNANPALQKINAYYLKLLPVVSIDNLTYDEKQNIKDGYADGRNYFIADAESCSEDELMSVLKGFSAFKKWQNSNMKIILLIDKNDKFQNFEKKLSSYRFKDDVVPLQNNEPTKEKLIACSYAYIHCITKNIYPYYALVAVQLNVPVISISNLIMQEYFANTIYYINNNEFGIAMIELYKDEALKGRLVSEAKNKIKDINNDETIAKFIAILDGVAKQL